MEGVGRGLRARALMSTCSSPLGARQPTGLRTWSSLPGTVVLLVGSQEPGGSQAPGREIHLQCLVGCPVIGVEQRAEKPSSVALLPAGSEKQGYSVYTDLTRSTYAANLAL